MLATHAHTLGFKREKRASVLSNQINVVTGYVVTTVIRRVDAGMVPLSAGRSTRTTAVQSSFARRSRARKVVQRTTFGSCLLKC